MIFTILKHVFYSIASSDVSYVNTLNTNHRPNEHTIQLKYIECLVKLLTKTIYVRLLECVIYDVIETNKTILLVLF